MLHSPGKKDFILMMKKRTYLFDKIDVILKKSTQAGCMDRLSLFAKKDMK